MKTLSAFLLLTITMQIALSCNPRFRIPKNDITITTEDLEDDVNVIIALLDEGLYERTYSELLSESLKVEISLNEFRQTFTDFVDEYGKLVLVDSRIMGHYVEDSGIHVIEYIIQYKTRTLIAEFSFDGNPDNLKIVNYAFQK